MILEDRKVKKESFLDLQERAVADTWTAHNSTTQLVSLLKAHGLCPSYRVASSLQKLAALGLDIKHTESLKTPFLDSVIHCAVNSVLRDIKHRARIPVPRCVLYETNDKYSFAFLTMLCARLSAWTLVGVADEGPAYQRKTKDEIFTLEEGQIFGTRYSKFSCKPLKNF